MGAATIGTATIFPALCCAAATYLWLLGPPLAPQIKRDSVVRNTLTPPVSVAVLVSLACVVFFAFPAGIVLAAFAAPVGAYAVNRMETAAQRARREQVQRDLPFALDLIVAALESGQTASGALRLAGVAITGPLGADLSDIAVRLDFGADPRSLWAAVGKDPVLKPIGRAFARAAVSGASATKVLSRTADEARLARRAQGQERARSVGVKTAAPLGLCFLPAFILIGIVPTIISAFQGLTW